MKEEKDKVKIITKVLNTIIVIATIGIIVLALYIVITESRKNDVSDDSSSKEEVTYLAKIKEVVDMLEDKYYGEIDMNQIAEGAIEGIMNSVDDIYTRYVSADEYTEMTQGVSQEYNGLGIHINYDTQTGGIIISNVMPDSPAEKQGLEAGDIFIKVADLMCSSETYYDCIDRIKTTEPTTVHIVYLRDGNTLEGDFTTEKVNAKATVSNVLDNNIGYIRLYSFDSGVSDEFAMHYKGLRAKNVEGLVIDLRNNPGGLVSEVYTILKSILPKGIVVKMVYKDGTEKVYPNNEDNQIDIPLVVLVNENSASASEIFAGAVKDLDVGEIVGTKTFGKGIVQSVEELDLSEGALSITTSRYYTAGGTEIHGNGITPDTEVVAKEEYKNKWYIPYEEDLELQKAIEIINATEK